MTYQRLCGPQKQPCPSPWACGIDCNFQTAETPHDKANARFWAEPGYLGLIDAPGNAWDRSPWYVKALVICAVIAVCAFTGLVVLK